MIVSSSTRVRLTGRRRDVILMLLGLVLLLLFAGAGLTRAADPSPANQCVACHTDAAKLRALTPPDPPTAEEGEG